MVESNVIERCSPQPRGALYEKVRAMSRRVRPYLFYDTTSSLCSTCLRTVEAKVVIETERVFLDK